MTRDAVKSLETDHATILAVCDALPDDAWDDPTGCARWAVRDLVAHMVQLFRLVVDPASLPPSDPSGLTERTNDRHVEAIRDTSPADLLQLYETLGKQTIAALAAAQDDHTPIDLGDLGTHPIHLIANAYAFDHLVHLRADLAAPRGPVTDSVPAPTDEQIGAALDWMLAGLPSMNEGNLDWLDTTIELHLTGPAGRRCYIAGIDGAILADSSTPGAAMATVTSAATDFLWWATARKPWSSCDVQVEGDTGIGKRFCDTLRIY